MDIKEQKAKKYADSIPQFSDRKKYCIEDFCAGWDEALKSLLVDASKELPEYDEAVWVINADGDQFYCHRSKEDIVKTDNCGWCNYTCSDIIAWIRPTSFKEILEMNKDVLMRLKDM